MAHQSDPPVDLLTDRSYPELASAVRARSESVLARWEQEVHRMLPAADGVTLGLFRDRVPPTLGAIAEALAAPRAGPAEALGSPPGEQATTRFHEGYQVNELLIEYHLLRRVVLDELPRHAARPLAADEAAALDELFDAVVRRSVIQFCDHRAEQFRAATQRHSKYLSFLSHDLRGGLNGISLMAEVIRRELAARPEFAELAGDLELIRCSIRETVATMDRFLTAERFREGKVTARLAPVNPSTLIGEIASQFTHQAKDKGLELKVESPAPTASRDEAASKPPGASQPPQLVSDRHLLSMILQNLLSNAVKFAGRGGVRIGAVPPEGGGPVAAGRGWRFYIADDGPGIAPEKLGEMFGPFAPGETPSQAGVGLGLGIVHEATRLLGGKVWAESQIGRGSTFYVDLPGPGAAPATAVPGIG